MPLDRALELLSEDGLLLEADAKLPNLAQIVAGEPIRGSWWSHPAGRRIYAAAGVLHDHPDVLVTKLVNGKITYVHRALWPALHRIATANEAWQTHALTAEARQLLVRVRRAGRVQATGKPAADLERRLLVRADSVHTEVGAHAKVIESWECWREQTGFVPQPLDLAAAKERLEAIARRWASATKARVGLPWP